MYIMAKNLLDIKGYNWWDFKPEYIIFNNGLWERFPYEMPFHTIEKRFDSTTTYFLWLEPKKIFIFHKHLMCWDSYSFSLLTSDVFWRVTTNKHLRP